MAEFNVVVDTSVMDRKLTHLEREQLPFARSLAANQAAFETMGTMRQLMRIEIDRPTPFTISSVRYRRGNKSSPAAEVYISGDGAKGTAPAKYLTITRGGRRGQRRSERVLRRAGILGPDEGFVPAPGVRLNAYGNIPASRMVQILSGIRAFGEQGFQANITARSRARGRRRSRAEYFVARGSDHLRRGVYQRTGRGRRGIKPVLFFVPLPSYGKTFDFQRVAGEEARRRFLRAWPASLERALRTAR